VFFINHLGPRLTGSTVSNNTDTSYSQRYFTWTVGKSGFCGDKADTYRLTQVVQKISAGQLIDPKEIWSISHRLQGVVHCIFLSVSHQKNSQIRDKTNSYISSNTSRIKKNQGNQRSSTSFLEYLGKIGKRYSRRLRAVIQGPWRGRLMEKIVGKNLMTEFFFKFRAPLLMLLPRISHNFFSNSWTISCAL
jgi:hypothetical protein